MPQVDLPGLAILLTALGLFFFLVVRLMLQVAPRFRENIQLPAVIGDENLVTAHDDAVLLVEAGGRIKSINPRARQIFRLQENELPNLERLSRKARPADALFRLCAFEGQARFTLDGRLVEGTSYLVTADQQTTTVVSLRYPEITSGLSGGQSSLSAQTLQTFTGLTQAMAASLDLEKTLQAILDNVEELIPADFIEISIWDAEGEVFIPYRFVDIPGADRSLTVMAERYKNDQGFSGMLFQQRQPMMIQDVQATPSFRSAIEMIGIPLRSFLGTPLIVGNEVIGALELGSMSPESFREEDLALVKLLSGQAAIAVHNALVYRTEQQRTHELSGLAQLAQAFSSVRNPVAVFGHLVDSITPLIPVDILGFLVYNEAQRRLEAQSPFHGLPDQIVELYHAQVSPGSSAERILLDGKLLLIENASEDETYAGLGLEHIAKAASLRETVLVPLSSGGHIQGYLQASNHSVGSSPFNQAELNLLMIVANQTASIIENATLFQQSRQRALRAEALRRITSLVSSAVSMDEILRISLNELAKLLHADIGVVFLVNQERGALRLHPSSMFGGQPELPDRLAHLVLDDPQFPFTVAGSLHIFSPGKISQGDQAIIPFYQSILAHWQVESLIAAPLIIRDEGIGEVWFGSKQTDFFDQGDVQVIATAAGQLAGVVEQSFLRSQTDENLRRRVEQMAAITRISRELSASLDLYYLLNLVYDEALRTTRADCGTVLLFDLENSAVQSPEVSIYVGHAPESPFSPLQRLALERDVPVLVDDFSRSDTPSPHPGILSALVVPIIYQRRTAGLICLHGKNAGQFDDIAREITQSLAVQAAIALNNALAYEEQTSRGIQLKREWEILARLIRVSRACKPSQSLQQSLSEIGQAIQAVTPFQAVLISVYDPETQTLERQVGTGILPEMWEELHAQKQPWRSIQQLFLPEYQVGNIFYIPQDRVPAIPEDVHVLSVLPAGEGVLDATWRQNDLLLIPLYDASQAPLGLISVDAPADNQRPDHPTLEALEVFAAQASIMIESYQRSGRLERRLEDMGHDQSRLEQAAVHARKNLPVMLHKELEQAITIRSLNQRMVRVRSTLDMAVLANRKTAEGDVLHTLASEMLTRLAMQYALIAEKTPAGLRLLEAVGSFPAGTNPDTLFGQRNPLRQILQEKSRTPESGILFVSNLGNNLEWQQAPLLTSLGANSFIGMQLDMGADRLGGILVIGQRTLPALMEEDRQVFAQLAYQVGVGLKNLQLLNETRRRLREVDLLLDFSRKLGSLQPSDILTSLIENVTQVLPKANAGWVGTWDDSELAIIPQAATGYSSNRDILDIRYALTAGDGEAADPQAVLPLRIFRTGQPERVSEVDIATQYHLTSTDLLRYRRATNGRLPISVLLVPLQVGESVLGVLFLENFEQPDAFTDEDEALASSFSRQATMALENARLYQASERRARQLQALTMVAGTITSSLQREELIASLLDQLKLALPYDTATLWLRLDETLMVAAASGFADNELRLNLSVAVEDSALFKTMIQTREPISVGDLRNDPRFPLLVEPDYLSWLGIPLIYKAEVIGLIALEKREADFYNPDFIQSGTTFAGQAAVSLENARLYAESISRAAELDERSRRLAVLNQLSSELVASLDIDYIFKLTGEQLLHALDAAGIAAVMIDPRRKYILQLELPARQDTVPLSLPVSPLFDHLQETRGIFQTDNIAGEASLKPLWENFFRIRQAYSLLVVPLVSGSVIQGWFLIYRTEEYRYTLPEIELARTMCNQSAIAVQNARLFAETRRLTADLERRVEERTKELRREHQNSQTLLHIITELSTSLDMGLVLNRTLNVLNESVGSEESLIILSQGTTNQYRSGIPLAGLTDGPAVGLSVERQIARWVVRSRQPVLITRVQEDGRWEMPPNATITYQSVLAVPLVMGEDVLGSLLLLHRTPDYFSKAQMGLMEATARQIGIALNNAELFNLIRDQSEHLGSMLREQQIESSRSRAILEAVADGVLVTDAQSRVTLLNVSGEWILGLKSPQVVGKSLEHFSGLFGKVASEWLQTIKNWSNSPSAYQNGETYAEQLDLENGRIVAVHLAPVYWRQEFLGTVSIFRDITHEVQVDRLKSEFVANVSHELRTPMTSIKGYVDIMLMGASGPINSQQEQFLKIVKSNAERLSVLVNDLLDISRIEAGRVSLNQQLIDIREIASKVVTDVRRRAQEEKRPITIELNMQPSLPFVRGDQEQVRQIITALVTNGYTYTPADGWVKVSIREAGKDIQVDVSDNGIGIALEAQHRIFERFYRGEDPLVLASAGTGLGLAIAKSLVEMNQGRIWFHSSGIKGEGSTFSFTLPVDDGPDSGGNMDGSEKIGGEK